MAKKFDIIAGIMTLSIAACSHTKGLNKADIVIEGPPGHPPGINPQPPMTDQSDVPLRDPVQSASSEPISLPGLSENKGDETKSRSHFVTPDAELSYGSPGTSEK